MDFASIITGKTVLQVNSLQVLRTGKFMPNESCVYRIIALLVFAVVWVANNIIIMIHNHEHKCTYLASIHNL